MKNDPVNMSKLMKQLNSPTAKNALRLRRRKSLAGDAVFNCLTRDINISPVKNIAYSKSTPKVRPSSG
ncbi:MULTISPECIES: hypothetical protein [unclassified Bradyrhizobium]|uniref:hypothetical protein n=1 Tax=unclassified Bradyrhizobium TaxID=2631580 RepID=UPI00211F3BD8|nr:MULTISPECIES: hypothetical protein [unclassified Bradyrhizobium]